MNIEAANDRIQRELHRQLDSKCVDLDRVEVLIAALDAFSQPVLDYEPFFHRLPFSVQEFQPLEKLNRKHR